jgi:hypothetical protein
MNLSYLGHSNKSSWCDENLNLTTKLSKIDCFFLLLLLLLLSKNVCLYDMLHVVIFYLYIGIIIVYNYTHTHTHTKHTYIFIWE